MPIYHWLLLSNSNSARLAVENRIDDDIQSVQRKQRRNSLFISTAGTFQFLAGILSATGLAITLPALIGSAATATAAGTGLAGGLGLGAAIAGLVTAAPVGLALLAGAALATGVAVASHYLSSRNFQSANFGALEINAKHTAKYLADELKQNNLCMTNEHEHAKRADGKSWQQYHAERACTESIVVR
ncbi:MAG: hypothetical protein LW823_03590 [Rickettsiales bacterium]|jgi:hypothetical protein|nr:hypothetical protein [Rickettsiales bacterium]